MGPAQPNLFVKKIGMEGTGGRKTRYARPLLGTAAAAAGSDQQQRHGCHSGGAGSASTNTVELFVVDKYSYTAKQWGLTVYKQMLAELIGPVDEAAYIESQQSNMARKGRYPVNEWATDNFQVKDSEKAYVKLRWRSWWPALYTVKATESAPSRSQRRAATAANASSPAAAAPAGPSLAGNGGAAAALLASALEALLGGHQSFQQQQGPCMNHVSSIQPVAADPSTAGSSSLPWQGHHSQSLPWTSMPAQPPQPPQLPQVQTASYQPQSVQQQGPLSPPWLPPPPPLQQQQQQLPPPGHHQQQLQPTVGMQDLLYRATLTETSTSAMMAAPWLHGQQGHELLLLLETQPPPLPLSQHQQQLSPQQQLSLSLSPQQQLQLSLSPQQQLQLSLSPQQQQLLPLPQQQQPSLLQQQAQDCSPKTRPPVLQHTPMPLQQPGTSAIGFPPIAVAPPHDWHQPPPPQQVDQLEAHAALTAAQPPADGLDASTAVPAGSPPPSGGVIAAGGGGVIMASHARSSTTAGTDAAAAGPSSSVALPGAEFPKEVQEAGAAARHSKRAQEADLAAPDRQLAAAGQRQSRVRDRRSVVAGVEADASGPSTAAGVEAEDAAEGEAVMQMREKAHARVGAIEELLPLCLKLGICGMNGWMGALRACITDLGDAKDMLALRDHHGKGYGLLNIMLHAAVKLGAGTGAGVDEDSRGGASSPAISSRGAEVEVLVVKAFEVILERLNEAATTAGSLPAEVARRMLLTQQDRDWHDTPSHTCARYNLLIVQRWLLERCDASMLLVPTKDGWLPLPTACRAGNLRAATAFLCRARELGLFEADRLPASVQPHTKVILADLTDFNKHYRTSGARMLLEKAIQEVWPDENAPAVFQGVTNTDDLKRAVEQLQTVLQDMDLRESRKQLTE
ncbi:hypothetical protein PLESTB_000599800 [Pleodorina starrii]|uniref:Uncharacterized protein n=1 Tax=Pleodorina starrii TaxID=330485 RepID=A0A9W6F108_9CHLO|nr:hypothetical protein PLESTM_001846900 [Pleodorina starrii]GLC52244.1 hypothetical protein PLESTB_000599800 [Pleodorina starrii]GLC67575.1 hypothetical protein PLESTF_000575900 [Pleodorina starrii]